MGALVNKASLANEIVRRTDLPPKTVAQVLDAALDAVRDQVARGERVVLSGFGTFERTRRNARTGRNPHTGEAVQIPARNVPAFRPGTQFREAVAAGRRRKAASPRSRRR